jgi:hypothetical protein
MVKVKKLVPLVAFAAFALVSAQEAAAQVCAGYPAQQGQYSLGARWSNSVGLLSPGTGTALGVEASLNRPGNAGVFGIVNLISPDTDGENHAAFGLGASYEIGGFIPAVPTWLSVCPVASVTYTQVDGNATFGLPLGLGFGATIGVPDAPFNLQAYAIPTFRLVRLGLSDINWDNNFGVGLGAMARFGNAFYVGIEFDRAFVDDANFDFALRGGITLPR